MEQGIWSMKPWMLVVSGGPLMIPLLVCSVLSLTLIIEKCLFFWSMRADVDGIKKRIGALVQENKIAEAVRYCDEKNIPLTRILKAGLIRFSSSKDDIREGMESASVLEIPRMERRLSAILTLAQVAPLLGFLGTVTGMVTVFQTVQVRSAAMMPVSAADLSGGIWEALITTVCGLMVAIPTFVAYNFFAHLINRRVQEMEIAAVELQQQMMIVMEQGQKDLAGE